MLRRFSTISAFAAAALALIAPQAHALDVSAAFNPSILISDAAFANTRSFSSAEQIQQFLESKNSVLANTSPSFLTMLSEPTDSNLKALLGDPSPNLGRLRTAAELIYDCAQQSGINPQVILVTLNKEQGLITATHSPDRLQRALNHSLGFDCPDSLGCGNLFPGFYYQCFGNVDAEGNKYLGAARSLMKSYNTPGGRGPTVNGAPAQVGQHVTIYNTVGDYAAALANQVVTLGNKATAALYRYTPHVFNGNYNFWKFFTAWFKYDNGTILVTPQREYYIIDGGQRRRLPFFTVDARKLNIASALGATWEELNDYPLGGAFGPPDNTVVKDTLGRTYVFLDSVMHPASSFVLKQRKLDGQPQIPISNSDAGIFTPGEQLTPSDGTVLRGTAIDTVFKVVDGKLQQYSPFVFGQRGDAKLLQTIDDNELATYPKAGFVPPLDGTIVRSPSSGDSVYVVSQSRRLPLTPELQKNYGLKLKDIVTLQTDAELASLPLGPPAPPKEGTVFSHGSNTELYYYKNGAKHPVPYAVANQRRFTVDATFEPSITAQWPDGIAIPPSDGTLVKNQTEPATYIVENGQLRLLTMTMMSIRKLTFRGLMTMLDADFAQLAKDGYAPPVENTYYTTGASLNAGGPLYLFQNGGKRRIIPFVAKQRRITPDWVLGADASDGWTDGIAVAPKEGTLLKGDNGDATVYVVSGKLLRPLTDAAFKRKGYRASSVNVISSTDLALLAKGDLIK